MGGAVAEPAVSFGFAPDARRAHALDCAMHRELGASLEHVVERFRAHAPDTDTPVDALLERLAAGCPHSPALFGRYYDLVLLLLDGETARAEALLRRMSREEPVEAGQQVGGLGPPEASERDRLYRDRMMDGMREGLSLHPPSAAVAEDFVRRYREGFDLLRKGAPELAAEVSAIVRDVVGVVGGPDDSGEFHGSSHYQLWGALFLNAKLHRTRVAMAEVIAHESAHSLLFGFCTREPLVLNDDAELYPSPLRADPRPMDGIYHATFVSARMHWAMARLLASGQLTEPEAREAHAAMAEDVRNFRAGYGVVEEHGRLTGHGERLMAGARDYMERAAG